MIIKQPAISIILISVLAVHSSLTYSQEINLEKFKDLKNKKLFKASGGINANSIFYHGNGEAGRDPFTYYINGSLSVNIAGVVDLPFSFNLTNVGARFNYPTPPNRLSLHPTYKWVTAHIGDISSNFSPYTLNGRLFRGAGVDLTPGKIFRISAIAGQLQRANEFDSINRITLAAYERFGYGVMVNASKEMYKIGMIVFGARDNASSLKFKPDSSNIFPQQNLVVSWNGSYKAAKNLQVSAEYAISAFSHDLRDTSAVGSEVKSILKSITPISNSTSFKKAIKASLNYKIKNAIIGIGYERIDPGYKTMGTYYFNNDLENITLQFSKPLFKDKANLSANVGFQHDDLDGTKFGSNQRLVLAVNLNYVPNTKIFATANYSNFQTYMHIKPLFQTINQITPFQNIDTLNFSQISQNANFNINYLFDRSERRNQSINVNLNYLDAADKQSGIVKLGNASQFFNLTTAYTLLLVPVETSFTAAFNASYNTIATNDFVTLGPTLSVNTKLFNQLMSGLVLSYNQSTASGVRESSIFNTRLNFVYSSKRKQNFTLSFMEQLRDIKIGGKSDDLVVTAGYNYYF